MCHLLMSKGLETHERRSMERHLCPGRGGLRWKGIQSAREESCKGQRQGWIEAMVVPVITSPFRHARPHKYGHFSHPSIAVMDTSKYTLTTIETSNTSPHDHTSTIIQDFHQGFKGFYNIYSRNLGLFRQNFRSLQPTFMTLCHSMLTSHCLLLAHALAKSI